MLVSNSRGKHLAFSSCMLHCVYLLVANCVCLLFGPLQLEMMLTRALTLGQILKLWAVKIRIISKEMLQRSIVLSDDSLWVLSGTSDPL